MDPGSFAVSGPISWILVPASFVAKSFHITSGQFRHIWKTLLAVPPEPIGKTVRTTEIKLKQNLKIKTVSELFCFSRSWGNGIWLLSVQRRRRVSATRPPMTDSQVRNWRQSLYNLSPSVFAQRIIHHPWRISDDAPEIWSRLYKYRASEKMALKTPVSPMKRKYSFQSVA